MIDDSLSKLILYRGLKRQEDVIELRLLYSSRLGPGAPSKHCQLGPLYGVATMWSLDEQAPQETETVWQPAVQDLPQIAAFCLLRACLLS